MMSIRSYFTVKQRDLPELQMVVSSSVAEVVRTEVKRTIGVTFKWEQKERQGYIYYITNIVYIYMQYKIGNHMHPQK